MLQMIRQQVEQHRVLGGVVVVHQRLGDAAGLRDHGDRGARIAVGGKQGGRAAENALTLLVVIVGPRTRHASSQNSIRAFSSEVETGSREENASKQESRASVLIQSEPKKL